MIEHGDEQIVEAIRLISEAEESVRADRPRAAMERAEEAIRASEGLPDTLRAAALHARGRVHDAIGDLDAASVDLAAASEIDPRNPQRWMFMGQIATSQEQWAAARSLYTTAIEVAESVGEHSVIPQAHWELAGVAQVVGEVDVAQREFVAALKMADKLGDVEAAAYAELGLAELEAARGEDDRARERYARVREMSDLLPDGEGRGVAAETSEPATAVVVGRPGRLPAPASEDPVLRIIITPRLGEEAEIELWPGRNSLPLRCVVPFRFAVHPRTEERLRWYIEEYAARPIDPAPAIAAGVEEELQRLGEALFEAVFAQPEAATIAARMRMLMDDLRLEIVVDTLAADALPWELLRDPQRGADLALTARSIVRTTRAAAASARVVRDDAAVRILVVIARPEGRLDIKFRSVADPLLRELTESGASVQVDVLRPPTFERLREVLCSARDASRPYDLLHFDGHGVVDAADGRSALVFESGDETGELVTGDLLGKELCVGDVPLLVMNACRSAASHQEHVYGSIAREALECGLAAVVAMRFDVYVPTAALFVGGFYRALGEGEELQDAVTRARRLLMERTDRGGLPIMRDWCVPAVYQAAPVRLANTAAAATRAAPERDLPAAPSHGFVGRDEVFVELEAALTVSAHAILRAVPGAGKTSAATEFARWYVRTGGCGMAGPRVSLAGAPSVDELRAAIGVVAGRPLIIWDDARELTEEHQELLEEISREGGRVLVVSDRQPESFGLPVVSLPNFPREEAYALATSVAADVGVSLTPEDAATLGGDLQGHGLAIELAVREMARRGIFTEDALASLIDELRTPLNGSPAPWTQPLGDQLKIEDSSHDATLVAQFRGYVSVVGLGFMRADGDFDAAEAALKSMVACGLLTPVSQVVYAIHPGLPVALAAAGRYEAPGREFAQAMAETASAWTALAETGQGEAPWQAEASNIVAARRLASHEGWWPLVTGLLNSVSALMLHGGLPDIAHAEIIDAAPDFVDLDTGEPNPGMEEFGPELLGPLAWVAETEGDRAKVVRLRKADVAHRRAAATKALSVAQDRRSDDDNALVRRLAVGLTNLGLAQRDSRDQTAVDTMTQAAELARMLGDWRLEALNRLNLGVYWMTVPSPPNFDQADNEFDAGYKLAIQDDKALAGKLMTERGTVHYERAQMTSDPDVAQAEFERAAQLLELATNLREPDAVLFHQLGQVHRHLGNLKDSRAWFEQAISLRDMEFQPGAGADARLHLAFALEDSGLLDEAMNFARSAEEALEKMDDPDTALQMRIEQTLARLSLSVRAANASRKDSPGPHA